MESYYFEYYFVRQYSKTLFLDLTDYIDEESLNCHDPKILNRGKLNGKLYALPYESDFDNLYYDNENQKSKNITKSMESLTWDELIDSINESSSYPLRISLSYTENFLSTFMEYASSFHNLTKEYDPQFYKVFYNDTTNQLYKSFYEFLNKYTNRTIDNTLYEFPEDALLSFLDGESIFYKGKASQMSSFKEFPNISSTLPPKYISSKFSNYLIINKQSEIDKSILVEIAKELTSKEIQLFKAKHFGNIPTFDFNDKSNIETYCEISEIQKEICQQLRQIKEINLKDIFKSKYSATYFEISSYLSPFFIEYLYEDEIDFNKISDLFKYSYEMVTTQIAITPIYCNLIIFGCIFHMAKIFFDLPPYSKTKLKIIFIFEQLSVDLIYIPMLALIYRIYRIYNSNSLTVKYLTNKKLFIIITICFFIDVVLLCLIHAICIYILVGSRLLLVIALNTDIVPNVYDLKDFVPISTKEQYKLLMNKIKNITSNTILKSPNSTINNYSSNSYQAGYSISMNDNTMKSSYIQ
ncbi:hypothetical protein BCR36DRAFT_351373 [Piromyces finnis]|uniref:Uncharacterized protein n=1 Tax=Piromyces finnis TaxID=1754191 RepID=A0A1Y1VBR9_9FUNG|nr:hypothetical protein BCR36DRAFT_351373 [Piromyces finnis]|eukprot:ORX51508.1 hypothetical protein BCR36DRAFT_351373 [Piromyces finnis]